VALRVRGEAMTYGQLLQRVERLAGWLRGRGVGRLATASASACSAASAW
jgi:acyl-coenzyme A synthetase/AMP-(fatty) acid ligase